jgi:hypothetical protein
MPACIYGVILLNAAIDAVENNKKGPGFNGSLYALCVLKWLCVTGGCLIGNNEFNGGCGQHIAFF